MQTGTKISGVSHLVLVGWAVFGGTFTSDPLPFEVQNVSVITAEQFAAMAASMQRPQVAETPASLTRPDVDTEKPAVSADPDVPPEQTAPQPTTQPVPDVEPETLPDQSAPEADASDTAPVLEPAQPQVVFEPQQISPQPQPRPVDRVAPVPVVAPPPDTTPDDVESPQINPDEGTETAQEPTQATAPEEANDRIITEADKPASLAPTKSPRPPSRPTTRPTVASTTPAKAEPDRPAQPTPVDQTSVRDAVAQALGNGSAAVPVPSGPPLTGGEKDALRVAVSSCWNVGSLSSAALRTTVVVGVSMSREGKPEVGTIRLLSSSGGADSAAKQAYEAARRAIIRCGAKGYKLPPEKFGQWRDIEMTFNPERMRIK